MVASPIQKVVVIGASAGGIDPLARIIAGLPQHLPVAVIAVQHLRADRETKLPDYLDHRAAMTVCLARSEMTVEAGHVYIADPGKHCLIEAGRLLLTATDRIHYVRPAADLLFQSAAGWFGDKVIGVVLSGNGKDGADGCRAIQAKGGVTMAQDKQSAGSFGMPQSAINAGVIDEVLLPEEMVRKIIELSTPQP